VLATDTFDFTYRQSTYLQPDGSPAVFAGVVGYDRGDWFLKNVGPQQDPCLNEINAVGYLIDSIRALQEQLDAIRAKGQVH
jgi:hypothetical protein